MKKACSSFLPTPKFTLKKKTLTLVPSDKPVFMSEFYKDYDPVPKTVSGAMYADLIRGYALCSSCSK